MKQFRKGFVIVLLMMIMIILQVGYALSQEYDFRAINWWMTRDEVIASEQGELLLEDEKMVAYAVEIINMETFLVYYFDERDVLWGSTVLFRHDYSDPDLYLDDFVYVKEVLTQKYGEPFIDDVRWLDDIEREESGEEVKLGNVRYSTFWSTETTLINLILEGEDRQILLSIDYCNLDYYLSGLLEELGEG